jgi:hypothetical protein
VGKDGVCAIAVYPGGEHGAGEKHARGSASVSGGYARVGGGYGAVIGQREEGVACGQVCECELGHGRVEGAEAGGWVGWFIEG